MRITSNGLFSFNNTRTNVDYDFEGTTMLI